MTKIKIKFKGMTINQEPNFMVESDCLIQDEHCGEKIAWLGHPEGQGRWIKIDPATLELLTLTN
jgi:hypothetical protein